MTAYDYHAQFIKASGASIGYREYAQAFEAELAAVKDQTLRRGERDADHRRETRASIAAERLAAWYGEAAKGDDHAINVLTFDGGDWEDGFTLAEVRAQALFQLVTVHRISYVIMVSAAAVDRATRAQKGGQ